MKILHYSLGLPPYRSGGLIKYSLDLMRYQLKSGDDVALLYPGDYLFWKAKSTSIKYKVSKYGIKCFEILNPSLVPLLYGVKSPNDITMHPALKPIILEGFYKQFKPDIFHIHTLMGLPIELIDFLKSKGVKIVFSSHDYYGLCPKVNFINHKSELCDAANGANCMQCNANASGTKFLKLRNSSYVMRFKNSLNVITNLKNKAVSSTALSIETNFSNEKEIEYSNLLMHYKDIFARVDHFHFNSSLTASVYCKYIDCKNSSVISVSHCDIKDNRSVNTIENNTLKIGFIGNLTFYKGFPILRETLIELYNEGFVNWQLLVWGSINIGVDDVCENIIYKGKYKTNEMQCVYNSFNLLSLPSIWKETFSFITLESLSYGVPVLVSENVGAKDIVQQYDKDFIVKAEKDVLKNRIKEILSNPVEGLKNYHEKLMHGEFNYLLHKHAKDIEEMYKEVLR